MKKIIYIFCIALASCGLPKLTTHVEQPTIFFTDTSFCISGGLSASINEDSLFIVFDEGFALTNGENTIKVNYEGDINGGQIIVEPNICISGSDFCLTGKYFVSVNAANFIETIKRGVTLGNSAYSVFIKYGSGKLTVSPKVCIKTK